MSHLLSLASMRSVLSLVLLVIYIRKSLSLSSLISLHSNRKLKGHLINNLQAQTVFQCAHHCLSTIVCGGYNFNTPKAQFQQGACELFSNLSFEETSFIFSEMTGWTSGLMISDAQKFRFTSLGAKGRHGPVTTNGYDGTSLEGQVTLHKGIQYWNVPQTGNYVIEAWGASGGNATNSTMLGEWKRGGLGARIKGVFYLNRGQELKILVGQQGNTVLPFAANPGSGGGGTFVTLLDNTPLVVAGGGGGGSDHGWTDGDHGQVTMNGSSNGGANGNGGKLPPLQTIGCGAGGGFISSGKSTTFSEGGHSFTSGGLGGKNNPADEGDGGFGGGGSANYSPGGGGGYSGGGLLKIGMTEVAGGGGSFNSGKFKNDKPGVNEGDGKVVITIL